MDIRELGELTVDLEACVIEQYNTESELGDQHLADIVTKLNGSVLYDCSSQFHKMAKTKGIVDILSEEVLGILCTSKDQKPSSDQVCDTLESLFNGDLPNLRIMRSGIGIVEYTTKRPCIFDHRIKCS